LLVWIINCTICTVHTSQWIYYNEPQTKRRSMEWHHSNSPWKKFNSAPSAEEVMAIVFWGEGAAEMVIFVELFYLVKPFNSDRYIQTLKTCRGVSSKFDLIKMSQKSFNMTTHGHKKFENTGSNNKTQMDCSSLSNIQPISCSIRFKAHLSPQRCQPWEQFWEWCWGFWRSGCEYNIQTATRTLVSSCCKVVEFRGDSCVIHPSNFPVSMFKES
jgi:hypothetical protein